MATLVVEWLNEGLLIQPPVSQDNMEAAMRSGMVIAEAMFHCGLMDQATMDEMKESEDMDDRVSVMASTDIDLADTAA